MRVLGGMWKQEKYGNAACETTEKYGNAACETTEKYGNAACETTEKYGNAACAKRKIVENCVLYAVRNARSRLSAKADFC